ncbi:MFS transporter [Acinetobacter sp. NIPH 2377]|uniref:MFS transporter n=1 Tax=Acinetobacter terrestris TaxID=2529843 RepID=UPI00149053D4|nr:MFS transporter [Acinetobacter terrestris]NNH36059.1 MFS transporter [Acinetobacter terrestris]
MTMNTVNVNEVIDKAKFTPFHFKVVFWCLIIILFDGYDLAINGVTLPLLMQDWGLSAVQAGMLASTALAGMMFGAMMFGTLADKIGRKKVIMICVLLFSGFTFAGGFASNPTEFGVLRFLAGLGIGGVMPNLVALTSEYAPARLRATLVTTMFSGYAVGGVMADKFHLKPVIITLCLSGAVALSLLGFKSPQPVIYFLVAVAGASAIGGQILLYSYVAQYYPLTVRSTGIGWASAVGRSGAVVGPILIGMLLGMELPHQLNFMAVGLPVVIVAIAVSLIVRKDRAVDVDSVTEQKLKAVKA